MPEHESRPSGAQRVLGALMAIVFSVIFIGGSVSFATLAASNGAPRLFSFVGWGFAALGVLFLVASLVAIFKNSEKSAEMDGQVQGGSAQSNQQPSVSSPGRCVSCGAAGGTVPCPYCGAA